MADTLSPGSIATIVVVLLILVYMILVSLIALCRYVRYIDRLLCYSNTYVCGFLICPLIIVLTTCMVWL